MNRDTLADLFERDHVAIDHLLDDTAYLCRHGSHLSACKVFGEARRLIEHHLDAEQRALLQLEREGHCPVALAERLGLSHDHVRALVENVWLAISGSDGVDFDGPLTALRGGLNAHAQNDRALIFPALASRYLDPVELDRAVHSIVDP